MKCVYAISAIWLYYDYNRHTMYILCIYNAYIIHLYVNIHLYNAAYFHDI